MSHECRIDRMRGIHGSCGTVQKYWRNVECNAPICRRTVCSCTPCLHFEIYLARARNVWFNPCPCMMKFANFFSYFSFSKYRVAQTSVFCSKEPGAIQRKGDCVKCGNIYVRARWAHIPSRSDCETFMITFAAESFNSLTKAETCGGPWVNSGHNVGQMQRA